MFSALKLTTAFPRIVAEAGIMASTAPVAAVKTASMAALRPVTPLLRSGRRDRSLLDAPATPPWSAGPSFQL
ncbi:MAG TPA: hypothetical protein DEP05_03625 [Betaproteobacteria bacterium]|nr:hypothetical protein [Betaproteobacteria bacterium]